MLQFQMVHGGCFLNIRMAQVSYKAPCPAAYRHNHIRAAKLCCCITCTQRHSCCIRNFERLISSDCICVILLQYGTVKPVYPQCVLHTHTGQGLTLALEDAVVLAWHLRRQASPPQVTYPDGYTWERTLHLLGLCQHWLSCFGHQIVASKDLVVGALHAVARCIALWFRDA